MSDPTPSGIPPIPAENPFHPPLGEIRPTGEVVGVSSSDKTMGMLCHLIALSGYFIPFGTVLGPLVVWLTQKEKSSYIDHHGKESLNFQITLIIALIVPLILCLILIGIPIVIALGIYGLVMTIIASIKAYEGVAYRYPYILRLVK